MVAQAVWEQAEENRQPIDFVGAIKAEANDSTAPGPTAQFAEKDDGVYFIDENNHALKICSPLKVLAETQTTKGENYGRLLEWRDSQNRVHSWAMPIELVHSDSNEHIKYS